MAGLSQTATLCRWNFRGIANRRFSAFVVVIGFFAVVLVFSTVLSVRDGIARSAQRPGAGDIAVVSGDRGFLDAQAMNAVQQAPGVARDTKGAVATGTIFNANLIKDWKPGTLGIAVVLGIDAKQIGVLPNFRIVSGRMFQPGLNEMVIGTGAVRLFPQYAPGRRMPWHHRQWKIVGSFTTGSNVQDTEFIADLRQAQDVMGMGGKYSGILVRLDSPAAFDGFKSALERRPGIAAKVERLSDQDRDMGAAFTVILTLVAAVITLLMAAGAIFAALNIMYANIAGRSAELAVLRAIGFSRFPVLVAVLSEAVALALLGGALAVVTVALVFNGFEASTIMGARQVSFDFVVTPSAVVMALALTLGMGFLGGLFPAIRAARLPIATALRED